MADIFVSYSSDDRARVEPLISRLEAAGYSVWWDNRLHGGAMFPDEIETELEQATFVVVAWTVSSVKSRWVADEADAALQAGKLIPVTFDDIKPPLGFRQVQTIDLSDWTSSAGDTAFRTLVAALSHLRDGPVAKPASTHSLQAPGTRTPFASIAVLPFVNMSSDPEQEYFSDGISEELLNLLARIREMRVIARTSSFALKGSDKQITEIGEMLGVAYVLEGSVRRAGDKVRITAQLIETGTGFHVWSEIYDRTLDDIFAVQDEISAAIVEALKDQILGGDEIVAPQSDRSANVEAFEHYLLGQQYMYKRTRDDLETARTYFERALALDPDYPPAMIGLADAHLLLSNIPGCYGTTPIGRAREVADSLLERALALEPHSSEAYGIMSLSYELGGDYDKARETAERAISINPNFSRGYTLLAQALNGSGDPAAPTISIRRQAVSLDPLSSLNLNNLAAQYLTRLNFDQAKTLLKRLEVLDPGSPFNALGQALVKVRSGHSKEALAILLDSPHTFQSSTSAHHVQNIAFSLGHGAQFEKVTTLSLALLQYAGRGMIVDARRLGNYLVKQESDSEDYETAIALSIWKNLEGQYTEALEFLEPFNEPSPDRWGRHFNPESSYIGARQSLYALRKLGRDAEAGLYLDKLRKLSQIQLSDPNGAHRDAHYNGAIAAISDGDQKRALDLLERQLARTMNEADFHLKDPNFEDLHDEPRFQALLQEVEAHFAAQKAAAEAAGLLPVSEDLLVLMLEA